MTRFFMLVLVLVGCAGHTETPSVCEQVDGGECDSLGCTVIVRCTSGAPKVGKCTELQRMPDSVLYSCRYSSVPEGG